MRDKSFATSEAQLDEVIKRGLAYKDAGADCFYPIALQQEADIKELVVRLKLPINIITIPGIPGLKTLNNLGVARVSFGPSFLKIAIRGMKELAIQLKEGEGLSSIAENEITSAYLKDLVNKTY